MNKSVRMITYSLIIVYALLQIWILFIPPQIGIANNGDFGRVLALFDIYYVDGYKNFTNFYDLFVFGRPEGMSNYNGYFATSSIFIVLGILFNHLINFINNNDYFYIYSLSLFYCITYTLAFYWIIEAFTVKFKLQNKWFLIIFGVAALFILNDSLFLEYFNSFYQEPGFLVMFLLFCAVFLRFNNFYLEAIILGLMLFSKSQNIAYIFLIAAIFAKHKFTWKKASLIAAILLIIFYINTAFNNYAENVYKFDGVFSGLLHNKSAEEAAQILPQIGLDSSYSVFANSCYWCNIGKLRNDPSNAQLFEGALNSLSGKNVILGYLYHPTFLASNYFDYISFLHKNGPFAKEIGNYKADYSSETMYVSAMTYYSKGILKNFGYLLIFNLVISLIIFGRMFFKKSGKNTVLLQSKNKNVKTLNIANEACQDKVFNYLCLTISVSSIIAIMIDYVGGGFDGIVKHAIESYFSSSVLLLLFLAKLLLRLNKKLT